VTVADSATLQEARDWLRARVEDGERCPCCTQLAKVYKRKLTSAACRALIALYRECDDWGHLPTIVKKRIPDVAHQGGYMTLSGYWGLMEEERERRPDGGRAGYWRITDKGRQFLFAEITIPSRVHLYDGRVLGFDHHTTLTIQEALGQKFDYKELMDQ